MLHSPASGLTDQELAVWSLLAGAGEDAFEPASGLAAEAHEAVGTIRAAITYRAYTRAQPLTVSQIADDLGARPITAAAALDLLHREQVLARSGDGGLFWVLDSGDLPNRAVDWALERTRAFLATSLRPGSPFPVEYMESILNVGSHSGLPGLLRHQGLLRREGRAWTVTRQAGNLPTPPRVPLPPPRDIPFTLSEIIEAVAELQAEASRTWIPAYPGNRLWDRTRAMAAQVIASLPPVMNAEQAVDFAALADLATALPPYEPAARRWHVASLGRAIGASLHSAEESNDPADSVPVLVAPPPRTALHPDAPRLTRQVKGRALYSADRKRVATAVAYAYTETKMPVDQIAEEIGMSTTTVYTLLAESRVPLRYGAAGTESQGWR
ncbi:hypothetical protein [Streptomyces virginiae]|uniref:hypothetical protein n=1 Tax=Streptomyces virginiae TaxID=1961 RepID=UPI00324CFDC8